MIKIRKRISEKNIFPNFDLYTEYQKIDMLLSEKKTVGVYNKFGKVIHDYFTLEEYIEYICFNDWNLRGTFISINEMRQGLGIEKGSISRENIEENHFRSKRQRQEWVFIRQIYYYGRRCYADD